MCVCVCVCVTSPTGHAHVVLSSLAFAVLGTYREQCPVKRTLTHGRLYNKQLACFMFDFGVVNTADHDCELRAEHFDHTGGESETTVVLGLQQLWSDAKSNRIPY